MKSFLKGIWSRTKNKPISRSLEHPRDLGLEDMLQLSDSYGLPPRLRDQVFKVIGISTYQFQHEYSTCFSLQGENDDEIDLTIEQDSGRSEAAFSLAISRDQVEQIFDMSQFGDIFEADSALELMPNKVASFGPWLADSYHLDSRGERGFYYDKDCRSAGPSTYQGDGEAFDFYGLVGDDGKKALEIVVYEGGETEVSLILNRSVEDIKDLWPAAST